METLLQAHTPAPQSADNGQGTTTRTQPVLQPWLAAQSLNLVRHAQALRPFRREEFGAGPEVPTDGHILEVNRLTASLRRGLQARARLLNRYATAAIREPSPAVA